MIFNEKAPFRIANYPEQLNSHYLLIYTTKIRTSKVLYKTPYVHSERKPFELVNVLSARVNTKC